MDRRHHVLAPVEPHPDAHLRRWIRLGLGSALSVVFIFLALRGVPLDQVGDALLSANPVWVLIALICVNAVNLAKAIRWQVILRPQAPDVSLRRLFAVLMIGQGMNAFAPLRVGDVARAYMVNGVGVGTVLYSVVVEKALDSLALLGLIAGVAVVMPLPAWLKQSGVILSLTLVAVLGLLILAGRGSRYILSAGVWIERALPPLRRFAVARRIASASGIMQSLGQGRLLGWLVLWTMLSWVLGTGANYVTFLAMSTPAQAPVLASTFLIVVLYLGAIVPSSPGKVGIFHYLVIISLALFGVDKSPALAYAVILHLIVYGPTALLGGYYVWRESQTRGRTSIS